MNRETIGRRAQDVQSGLRDVSDLRVSATIPITRQIGMAVQLAVHIRGLDSIENIVGFHGFCSNLGISSDSLPTVLGTLEQIGWIRVVPNVYAPTRIEETIPYFQEIYGALGEQWSLRRPGELEQATMAIIDRLTVAPVPLETLATELGLKVADIQTVVDIGDLGGYLRQYDSPRDRVPILYAPLFTEENPETLLNFIAKNPGTHQEIEAVFRAAKVHPGAPISALEKSSPLVVELVNGNILRAPAIVSSGGAQSFAFAPFKTTQPRAILEKARIILACIRYGEGYSSITKISDPSAILRGLRERKMIGRTPHSNIQSQYAAAANMGVGWIEPENGRYRFRLYDTEDNLAAVDLAIAMCSGQSEDVASSLLLPAEVKGYFTRSEPGGLLLPEANRKRARDVIATRKLDPDTRTAARLGRALLDDLRGIHRVIK
ncbi:hypothetical protein ABQE95_06825 [Xanthomonas campestris pv. campestris]|uniref:hypothetical protein n=1 Tax=Xanthomonas campestris TaxID=339 RepID=UPI00160CD6A0|nr:hypothetical protein [Xanthomonas campestris]MEB1197474.1 hypothetical protein [Xanthomonas campestris pv. campestris]MEA9532635.1 hypothetical protein [Xanthomonas campestris]MEB1268458.1 hypothetical protein [Xanthomonas campestris pv. campestris]MEB1280771.1 hypothetical protein [Xanthomonas campestris pv. campestris]MEB1343009.1 hypothetical protein [Xanthomonas campestris pv. campestris]